MQQEHEAESLTETAKERKNFMDNSYPENLCLRPMTQSDLPTFIRWLNTPHVARWYHDPQDWIAEIENQNGEFGWIHHCIVVYQGRDIGFCQYYACRDSDEDWNGFADLEGAYSIDYLIGKEQYLRKGLGKEIVGALTGEIRKHEDAKLIIVMPESGNMASRGLLLSCCFRYKAQNDVFVKTLHAEEL
jgi:RimJ/RimL family protein N-acetyltransferase